MLSFAEALASLLPVPLVIGVEVVVLGVPFVRGAAEGMVEEKIGFENTYLDS